MTASTTVSVNEIQTTVQKAFEAAGVPWNVDFRAAEAVAWLEQCGFDGVAAAACALKSGTVLSSGFPVTSTASANHEHIDADHVSIVFCGGYFLDYAVARSMTDDTGSFLLIVSNPAEPLAVLGWLATQSCALAIELRVVHNGTVTVARRSAGGEIVIDRTPAAETGVADVIEIQCGPGLDQSVRDDTHGVDPSTRLGQHELQSMLRRTFFQGVTPDSETWSTVKQAARGVLVPSTDVSRAIGTGGGDANE